MGEGRQMPVRPFIVSVGPNLELGEKHEETIARQVYGIYFYFVFSLYIIF